MAEQKKRSPWADIGWGLLLLVVGIACFFWFSKMETDGGRIRTHVVIVLVYSILGKWGVLGIFGGLGVLLIGIGAKGVATGATEGEEAPAEQVATNPEEQ